MIPDTSSEESYYSESKILNMRAKGEDKPKDLSTSKWIAPVRYNLKSHPLCYLAGVGLSIHEIADMSDVPEETLKIMFLDEEVAEEIKKIKKFIFGNDPKKRFDALLSDAVDTIEEVMTDENQKGSTRLHAANIIKETVMGKPTQQFDVKINVVRQLYEKLDRMQSPQIIDVTPEPKLLPENSFSEQKEAIIEKNEEQPEDPIDSFLAENYEE